MSAYSAPGKLLIAGEYSVLEGHPALVAAADRRATCTLEPGPALLVSGLGLGPCAVRLEDESVHIEGDPDDRLALVRAVLEQAGFEGVRLPRGHLWVDTSAFYLGEHKLGLGSSAAAAVALSAAVLDEGGPLDTSRVMELADSAHAAFSGVHGSGVDIAASSRGGVLRFSRADGEVTCEESRLCPPGLSLVVAFAGKGTSTRDFLRKVQGFEDEDTKAYDRAMDDLGYAAVELLNAVAPSEDPRVFLAAVDRCRRAMQRLGERARIDVVSESHRKIARLARQHGGAAKPSGAGGGDVAVVFVPDDDRERLEQALEAAGFPVVPLRVGAEGVRREAPREG
jgi:phosphomevalonate kinase